MAALNDYYRPSYSNNYHNGMEKPKPGFLRRLLWKQFLFAVVVFGLLTLFNTWDNSIGEYSRGLISNAMAGESDLLTQLIPVLAPNPFLLEQEPVNGGDTEQVPTLLLPANGLVTKTLEQSSDGIGFSKGVMIKTETDSPVNAAAAGEILAIEGDVGNWQITMDHGNGLRTYYGNLVECKVTAGQTVTAGSLIGLTGEAELQFAVTENEVPQDALSYLKNALNS